jgi:predicted secreted hydrolase
VNDFGLDAALTARRTLLRRLLCGPLALATPIDNLWAAAGAGAEPDDDGSVRRGQALRFPADFGAHPATRIEWWYLTGWLSDAPAPDAQPRLGFQVTFFRARTGLAQDLPGRFAPRQLLFAHAAVTDLRDAQQPRHLHAQRIGRWDGRSPDGDVHALRNDTGVRLGSWQLLRTAGDGAYQAHVEAGPAAAQAGPDGDAAAGDGFALDLRFAPTQPLLLQGDHGYSRKGPREGEASDYYSQPQLAVSGQVRVGRANAAGRGGATGKLNEGLNAGLQPRLRDGQPVQGRAWLDHEWSNTYLAPEAVGWDWIGFNLFDGSALMAFRLRRADGSALWAGGSLRRPGQPARIFDADEVRWEPGRRWTSPATGARYPVEWTVDAPGGRFAVRALLDSQELDARGSTGTVYWEGLSQLFDAEGRLIGCGYLEMTGYAARLRLGPG